MQRVVLIAIYDLESFAARSLHAVAARAGWPVTSIFFKQLNLNNTMDPATDEEIDALIACLKTLDPLLVGISVRTTYCQLAARISERIRRDVGAFVLWGGIHATIAPEDCLAHADAVCVGEGEGALLDLASALSEGLPVDSIRNLWLPREGGPIKNEIRPLIDDLDSLPFTDFLNGDKLLIENGKVFAPPPDAERRFYWIMSSRGCPYSCTYCCNNAVRDVYAGKGRYVRRRGVDSVLDELTRARRQFPKLEFVNFEDDVFTFDEAWVRAFKDRYAAEVGLPFFCYGHPKAITDPIVRMLKEAGVQAMTMGIQSGSQPIRADYFHRHDSNEEILAAAAILDRHGIHCAYDVILDNPLEDEEDRARTLDLLLGLPRPFELHAHSLTHFPATGLTRMLLDRGLIRREDVEDIKQMSYERWTPSLDLRRDRENLFWDNLYYMAGKRSFPEGLIRRLSRSRFLRRHPRPLTWLLRLTSGYAQTVQSGSRWDWARMRLVNRLLPYWRRLRARFAR